MARGRLRANERVQLATWIDARLKEAMDAPVFGIQDIVGASVLYFLGLTIEEQARIVASLRDLELNPKAVVEMKRVAKGR